MSKKQFMLAWYLLLLALSYILMFMVYRARYDRYKLVINNSIGTYDIRPDKNQDRESLKQLGDAICKTSGPNCTWSIVEGQ